MAIENLKSALSAGARPNKYRIYMAIPGYSGGDDVVDVLAKSTTLPDVTVGVIPVWNQGRKLNIAGDVAYSGTWDVTFYNTADLELKKAFEDWIKSIDDAQNDVRENDRIQDYVIDLVVQQLDGRNAPTASYILYNCWPSALSAVDLADDSADTISEFTATLTYSHWERTA